MSTATPNLTLDTSSPKQSPAQSKHASMSPLALNNGNPNASKYAKGSSGNRSARSAQSGKPAHNKGSSTGRYAPKKQGTSLADSSPSWRSQLSAEAKPFLPPVPLSVEAKPFEPTTTPAVEAKVETPVVEINSAPSTPKVEKRAFAKTPSSTRSVDEKYDYFNCYDVNAPVEFRRGIDAIFGLPFGGSLAYVFDGTKSHTVCKRMGEGLAQVKAQLSEKISVEVVSGGMNDGDVAKIFINGKDFCPNQKGVNILVVDIKTLDAYVGVFDTHTHIGNESSHLTRFLTAIPETHAVLIAVRYDASRRMHPEARQALRQRGVDFPNVDNVEELARVVDEVDANRGADLLSFAATVNAPRCAELLIKKGWDVNHQKKHGSRNTPLLDAVFHGSVDVVGVLLEAKANVGLHNKWQETAPDIASKLFGFHSLEEMVAHLNRNKENVAASPAASPNSGIVHMESE